jgi:hypothetical protein
VEKELEKGREDNISLKQMINLDKKKDEETEKKIKKGITKYMVVAMPRP